MPAHPLWRSTRLFPLFHSLRPRIAFAPPFQLSCSFTAHATYRHALACVEVIGQITTFLVQMARC
jgi:hypothetical protein